MKNILYFSLLEYRPSQALPIKYPLGILFYSPDEKKFQFYEERLYTQSFFASRFPTIRFDIIETYIEMIQTRIEEKANFDVIKESIDTKEKIENYIHKYFLTSDDSALQFGRVVEGRLKRKKLYMSFLKVNHSKKLLLKEFDIFCDAYFSEEMLKKTRQNNNIKVYIPHFFSCCFFERVIQKKNEIHFFRVFTSAVNKQMRLNYDEECRKFYYLTELYETKGSKVIFNFIDILRDDYSILPQLVKDSFLTTNIIYPEAIDEHLYMLSKYNYL